jgi:hypothetical protein
VRSKSVRFSDDLLPGTEANSLVSGACATSLPNDDLSVESAKMLTKKKSSYLLSKKYKISSSKLNFDKIFHLVNLIQIALFCYYQAK